MKKLIVILTGLLLAIPMLQSCLKDDEELFEDNASKRMQDVLDATKELLVAAENGWIFEMYPESSQSYGGYAFTLVFDDEKVAARSEIMDDNSYEVSSYYKMTTDDGPVLSFDTYNEIIHYFSTPSSSAYQGYQGEFEFVIMDATEDLITLQGKKTGNTMYMRPLETDPETYLDAVDVMEDSIYFATLSGTIGGAAVEIELDTDYRQMTFIYGDGEETVIAYAVTDKGVRLYTPITLGVSTVDEFYTDIDELTFISTGEAQVSLESFFPDTWRAYKEFEGSYIFYYYNGRLKVSVTLTPAGDKSTYIMDGLNSNYTWTLKYNKAKGRLELLAQELGTYEGDTVYLCAWDTNQGYLTWSSTVGMYLEWNMDTENPVYSFVDKGTWSGFDVDSFLLYEFDSDGNAVGQFKVSSWLVNSTNQFPYMTNLTKVD